MNATKKTVYVNAWGYESGGGFDWFHTQEAADNAFNEEKVNCDALATSNYIAYRFDVVVPANLADQEVTDFIDDDLLHRCDVAEVSYQGERSLTDLYALWEELGNSQEGDSFMHFPIKTEKEVIWRWFEARNPRFVVGEVMQGIFQSDAVAAPAV